MAANGGDIRDYEGVDRSAKPQLPMIAINTTAGTASEMTRFCIITDEARHIKMAIVDKHVTPLLSVNDSLSDDWYAEVTDRRNGYGCLNARYRSVCFYCRHADH